MTAGTGQRGGGGWRGRGQIGREQARGDQHLAQQLFGIAERRGQQASPDQQANRLRQMRIEPGAAL